jgi:hypothetical protein
MPTITTKDGVDIFCKGFPHGMPTTEADTINADLLTFLKAQMIKARLFLPPAQKSTAVGESQRQECPGAENQQIDRCHK